MLGGEEALLAPDSVPTKFQLFPTKLKSVPNHHQRFRSAPYGMIIVTLSTERVRIV
jgi:hypothetical protein